MSAGHPIASYIFNNHTIAASAGGTASATALVSSVAVVHARYMRIYNRNLRDLELIFGGEAGTSAIGVYVPCPLSATASQIGYTEFPIALSQGMSIRARTLVDTPITLAATTYFHISLWE